ncbi:hypothetical protein MGG_16396 [Pyricularia oryzae 70-15]|uniref:Uncharacterized protein n=1 Tax=Pyricularia oryzae (strain 70-15 / ATCC MYA-4617 / FGSC 8958) TaxID=242507 RepID=G4MMM8_PYRO7|nr:uncharacterized protein MGG_16396 [Pyricularia oryzae 70-15]EHA57800.1 hypothetical protein MGG_16396 [Pyricularia oryzae 70-15]
MCSFVRFEKNVGGWRGWFDDAREYHAQVKRGLQNLYLLQHVEETLQPAPGKTRKNKQNAKRVTKRSHTKLRVRHES